MSEDVIGKFPCSNSKAVRAEKHAAKASQEKMRKLERSFNISGKLDRRKKLQNTEQRENRE